MQALCPAMQVRWLAVTAALLAVSAGENSPYASAPVLPVLLAGSDHIREPECRNHSRMFLQHLANHSLWAVQMLDASAKTPEGVLAGNVYQLGQFDECVDVSVDELRSQYCLVDISFRPASYHASSTASPFSLNFPPRTHVWEKLKESADRTRVVRSSLHMGLCVPSSCSAEGLQVTLNHELSLLGERTGLLFKATVSPELCTSRQQSQPLSTWEIAYSLVAGIMVFMVVLSSFYANQRGSELKLSAFQQALTAFSVQRSLRRVTSVFNGNRALNAADGARFLFTVGCIAGHRLVISFVLFMQDVSKFEQVFRGVAKACLIGGALTVDMFFVTSGSIVTYIMLTQMERYKSYSIPIICLARIVRLTPVYMTVVFFHATWFYRTGSGPLWEATVGLERTRCRDNWWTNLLYVNNYINPRNMCMFQSWHLTCDTQMFVLCIPVIYWIKHHPRWGYFVLTTLAVLAVWMPFFNTWWRGLDALLLPFAENIMDPPSSRYFSEFYVRTENRVVPYLIGIMVGIILEKSKCSKFRINKLSSLLCFVLLSAMLLASVASSYRFYRPGSTYTSVEAGLYASLSRLFFAISVAGFSILIPFGSMGVLERMLSWKPLRVLSKMSYGAYLVHTLSLLYSKASLRVPIQAEVYTMVWLVAGDLVFSFSLSFLLLLLVEYPVRGLERTLFLKDSPQTEQRQRSPVAA